MKQHSNPAMNGGRTSKMEKLSLPVMSSSRTTGTTDPIMRKTEETKGKLTRKNLKSVTLTSCKLPQMSSPPGCHHMPSKRSKYMSMLNCGTSPSRAA